ncbi:MAG: hypothetical protein OCD76_10110 [Reichenbachiella sp.]
MIKHFILFLFLIGTQCLQAQEFSTRLWHEGWVVTSARDTLKGQVKYSMESNSVQVIGESQKVKTFGSKQLIYLEIFDMSVKNYRQFYSIPYMVTSDFRAPIIFEVIYEGPTSLIAREKIVLKTDSYNQSYYYAGPTTTREALVFTYYFAFKSGEIKEFTGKKGEIYSLLEKNPEKLKTYIKKNKLDVTEMKDLIRILAFYNSI